MLGQTHKTPLVEERHRFQPLGHCPKASAISPSLSDSVPPERTFATMGGEAYIKPLIALIYNFPCHAAPQPYRSYFWSCVSEVSPYDFLPSNMFLTNAILEIPLYF